MRTSFFDEDIPLNKESSLTTSKCFWIKGCDFETIKTIKYLPICTEKLMEGELLRKSKKNGNK